METEMEVEAEWIGGLDEMEAGTAVKGVVLPENAADLDEMEAEGTAGGGATATSEEKECWEYEAEWEYEHALTFRDSWISIWGDQFGSFEETTAIQPMRYTDAEAPGGYAQPLDSLQIYSIKVADIRGGLRWPIHVYGMIAARDVVDRNRNIIFDRSRDHCQTLTKQDSCLVMTGPTRPIVMLGAMNFEITLKVKEGSTESRDKVLSFLAVPHDTVNCLELSCATDRKYVSKLSTLEFTMSQIARSVEATISVQMVDGSSWPHGVRGEFSACTTSMADRKVVLLDSGSEKEVEVGADGMIQLSRCVASVEFTGELKVCVDAWWQGEVKPKKAWKVFKPKKAGRNYGTFNLGGACKVKVTVAWSLLSYYPVNRPNSPYGSLTLLREAEGRTV
ncbi:hypothetical protein ACQJBY_057034 [Aegilops geniculata]